MSDYKVKSTKNYNMFQISENNRQVDEKHVDKFVKEFGKNGYMVAFPIVVVVEKARYKIIDGQHRFLAAQRVGCYFSFIEIDVINEVDWLEKLQKVNKLSKKWSSLDYLRLSENENIKEIIEVIKANKRCQTFITQYCNLNHKNRPQETRKETDITKLKKSVLLFDKLLTYQNLSQSSSVQGVRFVVENNLDLDRLLKNIDKQPMKLTKCATSKQFTEMIEYFYNYDYPKANRVKFDI